MTQEEQIRLYRLMEKLNWFFHQEMHYLDRETADRFAHRFGEDGTVYEAQIRKEHILALFTGRNESEAIVDPRHLEQIMESPEPQFDMQMT